MSLPSDDVSYCGIFMVMLTNKSADFKKYFLISQPKYIYFGTRFSKVIGNEKSFFTLDV